MDDKRYIQPTSEHTYTYSPPTFDLGASAVLPRHLHRQQVPVLGADLLGEFLGDHLQHGRDHVASYHGWMDGWCMGE